MNGFANATALALVHFLWQGALVALATGGVLALLEQRRASIRYAVAVGALLVMAALPVITALQLVPAQVEPRREVSMAVVPPGSAGILPASSVRPGAGTAAAQSFGGSLLPWVLGLWLAGVSMLSLYHLGGWGLIRRLPRQGRPAGAAVAALAQDLCRRLRMRRAIALLESSAVSVPTVIGWLRPVVLVPASALAGLSPAQLEAILAHELAHVRRHDYLINLFQTAVETLFFYHPAVWWVSAQIRRERENCCDDLAVAVCGDRLSYARALVDLEGLRSAPRLAVAASGGSLSARIRRLVGAPGRPPRRFWAAGLLALALLTAGAAVQSGCGRVSVTVSRNASSTKAANDPGSLRGRWTAKRNGNEVRLEITMRKSGWGSWASMDDYPVGQLAGLTTGPDVRFEMRRDAGTFRFRGSFDGSEGRGTVIFSGNPAFAAAMGLSLSSDRLMELAVQDISFDFTREMKELGYGGPSVPVVAIRKHRSPFAFLHDLVRRGDSPVDQLVQLRIHDITPEYVRGMQEAGYPHLETWQLVELRNHAIEPDYVKGLRESGFRRLFPFEIIELQTHGISSEWVRGIAGAGYGDATSDQLISMHDHAIDGGSIRRAQAQGYRGLRPEQLIELSDHGKLST